MHLHDLFRSLTKFFASSNDAHPVFVFSTVPRHVVLVWLFSFYIQAAMLGLSLSCSDSSFPYVTRDLTILISALMRFDSVFFIASSFEIPIDQLIFSIPFIHVNFNISSFLASSSFNFHATQTYNRIDLAKEL